MRTLADIEGRRSNHAAPLTYYIMQTYYVYEAHSGSYLGTVKAASLSEAQNRVNRDLIIPCVVTDTAPLDLSNF